MFQYNTKKQEKQARSLIKKLREKRQLKYSEKLDQLFQDSKITYAYLEEFALLMRRYQERIIFVAVPRISSVENALLDLQVGYDALSKPLSDVIPYVEYSFPEEYECRHGPDYKDCYFFLFTKYSTFLESENCVGYNMNKINKLKTFL